MKLIDALKINASPFEIPDCSREDLPELFVQLGFKTGAEIGVYKAEFSVKLAQRGLSLFAIDPWREYNHYKHNRGQSRFDFLYEHTKRVLAPFPKAQVVRKSSMEAVEDFEDESLDFVYIDANHDFRYIAEDLAEWTKKVKKGGIVSGHDYFIYTDQGEHPDIGLVLKAYLATFNIPFWYLIGREVGLPGERRDRSRSWMFKKP